MNATTIDVTIIASYFIIIVVVGIWSSRRRKNKYIDYSLKPVLGSIVITVGLRDTVIPPVSTLCLYQTLEILGRDVL